MSCFCGFTLPGDATGVFVLVFLPGDAAGVFGLVVLPGDAAGIYSLVALLYQVMLQVSLFLWFYFTR